MAVNGRRTTMKLPSIPLLGFITALITHLLTIPLLIGCNNVSSLANVDESGALPEDLVWDDEPEIDNDSLPPHFFNLTNDRRSFELKYYEEHNDTWSERVVLEIFYYALHSGEDPDQKWKNEANWLDEFVSICQWHGVTCQAPDEYYLVGSEGKYQCTSNSCAGNNILTKVSSEKQFSDEDHNSGDIILTNKKTNKGNDNQVVEEDVIHVHDYSNYFTPANGAVVTKIELPSNNLTGTLPSELYMLPYLRKLNLEDNQITGAIPTTLGLTTKLRFVNLGRNSLSGSIPREVANMTMLDEMLLDQNELTGTLPPLLALLPRLIFFDASYNHIVGTISPMFGNMRRLEVLYLEHNEIVGTIPTSIYQMEKLRILDLSSNQLGGTIPTEIGLLSALETLILDDNQLSGTLPKEILQLSELEALLIQHNWLEGGLHEVATTSDFEEQGDTAYFQYEWTNLPKLEKLFLNSNYFTGPIPPGLGALPLLRELDLSFNAFTGTIVNMGELNQLRSLDLSSNKLTGTVPYELGDTIFLYYLNLTNNELTGSVPVSLCEKVWLNNGHVGSFGCDALLCPPGRWHPHGMATELGGCSVCSNGSDIFLGQTSCDDEFVLGDMDGDGVLSSREILHLLYIYTKGNNWGDQWKDWKNVWKPACELPGVTCRDGEVITVDLKDADLCGGCNCDNTRCQGIPEELGLLSSLESLDLSKSASLASAIPSTLGNLENLKVLDLSHCPILTGTIPVELGNCKSLRILNLNDCSLEGRIPSSLGNLKHVRRISLGGNNLSGSLPSSFGHLETLEELLISRAHLTGTIPVSIGNLARLEKLELHRNNFEGTLLEEVGKCTSLTRIEASDNNLVGHIPSSLGRIPSLELVHLKSNKFSGTIPREFGSLSKLFSLDLSLNDISGEIPSEIGMLRNLRDLRLSGNRLKGTIPSSLCVNRNMNGGQTEMFGCDAILCSIGTYAESGYSTSMDAQCRLCPEGETTLYLGSTTCLTFSQREVLTMFYEVMGGESWPAHRKKNWLNPDVSECHWSGVTCDSNGVIDSLSFPASAGG